MDEIARRYVVLGLRLGRLVDGFVDSYVGPAELRAEADAGAAPDPLEVAAEADGLRAEAASLPGHDAATVRRRAWFDGQLRAMAVQARRAAGEELPYVQLVEEMLGLSIVEVTDRELLLLRARLDDALPGGATLTDRVLAFRAAISVPADRTITAMQRSAARFAKITRRDFVLPDEEGIDWEVAHDVPWGAYAGFTGRGRTTIRVNIDLPRAVSQIPGLVAHETYPGHHAEHITKERTLIVEGLGEATLRTMNTPESVLAEGQADVARKIVMSDRELADEMRSIGRELGIEADWDVAVMVERAMLALEAAVCRAALMLHRDGRGDDEVRDFLQGTVPREPERLAHLMRVLHHSVGSTYEFTYVGGARLIRPWLELQGQTAGFARLLAEQLSPAVLRADLAAAGIAPAEGPPDAAAPPR